MTDPMKTAIKVKQKNEKQWLRLKGVVAVGIGRIEDKPGIIISVENDSDIPHIKIPALVENVPTKIQSVGRIEAF
ncbi:MAG: hypothetical protein LC658_07630 [Bacteroidales bacterium]|nr:hypothetical protein [Bacteroidales bacterium]